jgi:hypothetical protein
LISLIINVHPKWNNHINSRCSFKSALRTDHKQDLQCQKSADVFKAYLTCPIG